MINLKETKRIKDELAKNSGNYQSIIESTPLAICITNESCNFVAVNKNYLQLYGYSLDELVGKPFTIVVPEENREALKHYHDKFFVDKYEILRKWIVQNKKGEQMEIYADAGYHENINGSPAKITLIQFQKIVSQPSMSEYSNSKV